MTPREPDRFDKQALEITVAWAADTSQTLASLIATALRAAESSALERAARIARRYSHHAEREIRALIPPAAAPAAETGKAQGVEARVPEAWVEATRNAIADYLESDAVTEKYWKHSGALADLAQEIRKIHVTADVSAKLAARVAPPEREGKT